MTFDPKFMWYKIIVAKVMADKVTMGEQKSTKKWHFPWLELWNYKRYGPKTHDALVFLKTLCTNQVSFKSDGVKIFLC